jgi:hypothetical protein
LCRGRPTAEADGEDFDGYWWWQLTEARAAGRVGERGREQGFEEGESGRE